MFEEIKGRLAAVPPDPWGTKTVTVNTGLSITSEVPCVITDASGNTLAELNPYGLNTIGQVRFLLEVRRLLPKMLQALEEGTPAPDLYDASRYAYTLPESGLTLDGLTIRTGVTGLDCPRAYQGVVASDVSPDMAAFIMHARTDFEDLAPYFAGAITVPVTPRQHWLISTGAAVVQGIGGEFVA